MEQKQPVSDEFRKFGRSTAEATEYFDYIEGQK